MTELSNLTPDPLDTRDYIFEWDRLTLIPAEVDHRSKCSNIEDQLNVGSCTSNTMCSNAEMFLGGSPDMSRLFNYWTSRQYLPLEHQNQDSGSSARMSLRAAKNEGIPPEPEWPYVTAKVNTPPDANAYEKAQMFKAMGYYRIADKGLDRIHALRYAIASGYPVQVAMRVGTALKTQGAGVYDKISPDNPYWGNHEMLAVRYAPWGFTQQNSWGPEHGDVGFVHCTDAAMLNDSFDLWVLKGFSGVERIADSQVLHVDVDSREAQILRLYLAMLNRRPSIEEVTWWVTGMDTGLTLADIAERFLSSPEFLSRYGAAPSDEQLIEKLYINVLSRLPDPAGNIYWLDRLDPPQKIERNQLVISFSESAENKTK